MPCAGPAGHNGCQGVWWFAREQKSGAIWQVQVPGEHGVNRFQVSAELQRQWRDPHLVVVAVFNTTVATLLGRPRASGSPCASGPTVCVYRSIIARKLCPLSAAVLLSSLRGHCTVEC